MLISTRVNDFTPHFTLWYVQNNGPGKLYAVPITLNYFTPIKTSQLCECCNSWCLSNNQVIARCHRSFRHSKGGINYIDTDHQTLQTLLIVWLLIHVSLNVKSISDQTVYLPYLNTTQFSAKLEGKRMKVSLANFCSELLISIETENITGPVGRAWWKIDSPDFGSYS